MEPQPTPAREAATAVLPDPRAAMRARYEAVRRRTEALAAPLSPEDCVVQSMPDASPTKWHLAHTTWFFETFLLAEAVQGLAPFHEGWSYLFNSYYDAVGPRHARPLRGLLTRPPLAEVAEYRRHVDDRVLRFLERGEVTPPRLEVVELGLNHEAQHQELLLTDILHALHANPLRPAYGVPLEGARRDAAAMRWIEHPAGLREIGHDGPAFAFDNEGPRHQAWVPAFRIAGRPVTNGEFMRFIEDRGYQRPDLWMADGWQTAVRDGWRAPLYWEERDGAWMRFTLAGVRAVREEEPVCHVSWYEADAYARWANARLPREEEWEVAVEGLGVEGNFADEGTLAPAVVPAARAGRPAGMFGHVWEWTAGSYAPYPGFRPPRGALGEYNGKFMCNQMVLRGGSCATPRGHVRPTYRNFFYPWQRWQFSGIRLAADA